MWFLEAIVIVGGSAIAVAVKGKYHVPFCERCNRYCEVDEPRAFSFIKPKDRAGMVDRMEHGDFSDLEALSRINPTRNRRSEIELTRCSKCRKMHLLSIETIDEDFNTDDGVQEDGRSESVVNNLYVPVEVHRMLRAKKQAEQKKKRQGNQKDQEKDG